MTNEILADRMLFDLIERLEETFSPLDAALLFKPTPDEFDGLISDAVEVRCETIAFLLDLREQRLRLPAAQAVAALRQLSRDVASRTTSKRLVSTNKKAPQP
jgi:hypothetical protein